MTEQVDFYILAEQGEKARMRYACRVANKAYPQHKVFVITADRQQAEAFDSLLWTFSQGSFVPHGLADENSAWQDYPVQIGTRIDEHAKQADVLINLMPEASEEHLCFSRVLEFVGADEDEKSRGRTRFRFFKAHGLEPATHRIA